MRNPTFRVAALMAGALMLPLVANAQQTAKASVTFTKDVAPIFQAKLARSPFRVGHLCAAHRVFATVELLAVKKPPSLHVCVLQPEVHSLTRNGEV